MSRAPAIVTDISAFARLVFSGHGKGVFAVTVPVLGAFIDESYDEKREHVFCLGAFLANEVQWNLAQIKWLKRLAQDEIEYFRSSDCKSLEGPFKKLIKRYNSKARAHEAANAIRADLEDILLSYSWLGFALGVVMPDYQEVFHITPAARMMYSEDPTEAAFSQLVYEIALSVQRNAPGCEVAYVIDDSSYSGRIAEAFKAVKHNHPELAPIMRSILPLDDKVTMPLQAADLIAGAIKDGFLDWVQTGQPAEGPQFNQKWFTKPNHIEMIGLWNKEHMLHSIRKTITNPKFISGELARKIPRKITKSEQKRMRKVLIAKVMRERKGLI